MSEHTAKFQRLNTIIQVLHRTPQIGIADLSKKVFTSKSTLRRDLITLENSNIIRRHYGMIELLEGNNIEYTYAKRRAENAPLKRAISQFIASQIPNNAAFFIDGSSTFFSLPNLLHGKVGLHVITNNVNMGMAFNELNNVETVILGGLMAPGTASTLGSTTLKAIQGFHPDFALISSSSIDSHGIYVADPEQAAIKEEMITMAKYTILGIDSTKFEKSDYVRINNLDYIDEVVTDKELTTLYGNLFDDKQIKVKVTPVISDTRRELESLK